MRSTCRALAAGVTGTRWRNAKSLLRQALALISPDALPARSRAVLLPEWSTLLDDPTAAPLARGLARFSKYCSARRITPQDVTQAGFDTFLAELTDNCLLRNPSETQQTAGKVWNTALDTAPKWPQLKLVIASRRKNPSLPWTAFQASLGADVDAFLTPRSADTVDLSRDTPVLRSSTIEGKRLNPRQFATALVEAGVDAASLRTLDDVIRPETAQRGLEIMLERAGGRTGSHIEHTAYLLLTVARHYVKPGQEVIVARFMRNLAPPQRGMMQKNRKRLRQLDDPRQVASSQSTHVVYVMSMPATTTCSRDAQSGLFLAIRLVQPPPRSRHSFACPRRQGWVDCGLSGQGRR